MKHIGIVDITTVGACICANEIVAYAARQGAGDYHPPFTLHAFPFGIYKELVMTQSWEKLADKIHESILILKNSGADFIIIPSNTPHYAYDKLVELSPIPILNLITIAAEECFKLKAKKVLVLGTMQTMNGGLYERYLHKNNINTVEIRDDLKQAIHDLIVDEIIPGKINSENITKIGKQIAEVDCDVVILGCTELPAIYSEDTFNKPVVDTTRLLAHHAWHYAMGDNFNRNNGV